MVNSNVDIHTVLNYIKSHWKNTVRFEPDNKGTLLGLPYPYTVPSQNETTMQIFFYWDIYFTNIGLLKHDFQYLAKKLFFPYCSTSFSFYKIEF